MLKDEKDEKVKKDLAEFKQFMKESFLIVSPQGILISPEILKRIGINIGDLIGIFSDDNDKIGISRINDPECLVELERQGEESIRNMAKGAVEEIEVIDRLTKEGHIRVHVEIPQNIKQDLESEKKFRIIKGDKEN